LDIVTEPFAGLVLASNAGHIGLVFLAGQADNVFASALRLTRVLNSPAVQFALGTGRLIVGVTARFSPSSHVHKARALGVMSYSHRIEGAFKGSRPRMPLPYLVVAGGGLIAIAVLPSCGFNS
jgi:hypothetical protein